MSHFFIALWEKLKFILNALFTTPKDYGTAAGATFSGYLLFGRIHIPESILAIAIKCFFVLFSGLIGGIVTEWATQFGKRNPYHKIWVVRVLLKIISKFKKRGKQQRQDEEKRDSL